MNQIDTQISSTLSLSAMQFSGDLVQTVNARDLHTFLKVGKMFAHWIKGRIEQYDFVECVDYITHLPKQASGENQQVTEFTPGVLRKDYYLTMDMAKELSMIERNAQGKIARQYFIQCEKIAKASVPAAPGIIEWNNPLQVAGVLQQAIQRVICLQEQLDNSTPRLDASYFSNGERP